MVKIAIVYTGVNSVLMELIDNTIKNELSEIEHQIVMYANPNIIKDISDSGKITQKAYTELFDMYWCAVKSGAKVIYNICSSVGEIADNSSEILDKCGVKLVKVDDSMCEYAVKNAKKIGVLATLNSTLNPTMSLLEKHAQKIEKEVEIEGFVIEGMFGKSVDESREIMIDYAKKFNSVDIIVLAQASMSGNACGIEKATGIQTISSPVFGAKALKEVVENIETEQ